MKIALSIALGLLLISCSEDATVSSKEASPSSKAESIYSSSDLKLTSERDSISYTLGFEMSKPFITDTVFSKLNKTLITKGFNEDVKSYSVDSCMMIVQSYMSSIELRRDENFANQCAQSVGRLNRSEIQKTFTDLEATEIIDMSTVQLGFQDGLSLKNVFKNDTNSVKILFASLKTKMDEKYKISIQEFEREGIEFLKKNKNKKGVKQTFSGLQYEVLKKGKGKNPTAASRVKVHYKGTLLSGETFDSSYERGTPSEFGLNQVIPGWTEGIQLMKPGSKFIFYIPHELAYGPNPDPRSGIKPYSLLIFEVELLEILNP
jgi:FKBP-type peptidyl-prolyl cis-trans isomerase FklB